MNLLGSALYDPAVAVSKATSSLLAMTAFDTTNLRLAITVPAHGKVRFRLRCTLSGATTFPTILLGVMNGAAIVGRVAPIQVLGNTAVATAYVTCDAEFTATGLTPGALNADAAYGVETVVAATNIKYGGPNDTTANNAWGAFVFEAWDPQPLTLALDGGVNVKQLLGTAWLTPGTAGTPDVNVKLWNALTTVALPVVPTVAGRTLDISAGGEAGLDWANVGTPGSTVALSATTVATVTTTTTATTATNLTNLPSIPANWLTAAGINAAALNGKGDWNIGKTGYALSAAGVQAIWDALTSALTTVGSIGKLLVDNINATISSRLATAGYTAPLDAAGTRSAVGLASANLDTQLGIIAGYIDTEIGTLQTTATAIKTQTDKLIFTTAGYLDSNVLKINGVTIVGNGAGTPFNV